MQESITRGSWLQSSDGKTYFRGTVNRYSGTRATVERDSRATMTKYRKLASWNNQNVLFHSLGASSPKSRAMLPLKSGGKDLFQASLLASANSLLWQHHSSLYRMFSLCVSISKFPLFRKIPVILAEGPFLFQRDLTLTHDIWHIS